MTADGGAAIVYMRSLIYLLFKSNVNAIISKAKLNFSASLTRKVNKKNNIIRSDEMYQGEFN